ncbi:unknown [Lachnospiraceae bacterium CAG:215]|nr:unknown [Lachnospiraceae bacterium CAG:215]
MFFIYSKFIIDIKIMFQRIADRIQTSVSNTGDRALLSGMCDRRLRHDPIVLCEMTFLDRKHRLRIDIMIFKNMVYPFRTQLLVCFIRHVFHEITDLFFHLLRQTDSEILFQDIVDAALSGLTVDTDHIRIIGSSHVLWIDRKIRDRPFFTRFLFSPGHPFRDRILMRSGKCGKHKFAGIRLTRRHFHSRQAFIDLADLMHIGEIQFRIHTMRKQVHRQSDNVHIACTFSVSE